jgi:hypothetical protein
MTQKNYTILVWTMLVVTVSIGLIAWGQTVDWQLSSLTPYQWFPLFGILAWLIMWTHYGSGYFRIKNHELKKPKYYAGLTGWIVLACLFLHPGILAFQQYRNNQGIPPESFVNYVGESMQIAVMAGSIALIIFLSFEVYDRMKNNKWVQKYSIALSVLQSLAMTLIFVHGLRLGTSLGDGWFRVVWIVYGLLLIPIFYTIHKSELEAKK